MANSTKAAVGGNQATHSTATGSTDPGLVTSRVTDAMVIVAWYNAAEVLVLVFFVFKRFKGLYFLSIVVCAIGTIIYSTGKSLILPYSEESVLT